MRGKGLIKFLLLCRTNFDLKSTYGVFDVTLNRTIGKQLSTFTSMFNTKKIGYIDPASLIEMLNKSMATYANYSVLVTGFDRTTKIYSPSGQAITNTVIQVSPHNTTLLAQ